MGKPKTKKPERVLNTLNDKFIGASQSTDMHPNKATLVFLDTKEHGRHLVDVRQLSPEIIDSIDWIKPEKPE